MLNTATNSGDLQKQRTFLKMVASRFDLSGGNRMSVTSYVHYVKNHIILGASKDNKEFANVVDTLRHFNGEYRLDLAVNSVLGKYYPTNQASSNGKVIVLIVSHKLARSPDFCPPFMQPYQLASKLKDRGVRVLMAVVNVNTDKYFKELINSGDEVWRFSGYDDLLSAAGNFSNAICKTSGKLEKYETTFHAAKMNVTCNYITVRTLTRKTFQSTLSSFY